MTNAAIGLVNLVILGIVVQGSHGDGKTWKMKMVMEKFIIWNMQNWPKVMELCCQS